MVGENFVILVGKITKANARELDNGNHMFKARLAIPDNDEEAQYENFQYIKVGAWGTLAEDLGALPEGTYIRMHGHIEESSYDGECRHCKSPEKKYWTEVIIDNYILV